MRRKLALRREPLLVIDRRCKICAATIITELIGRSAALTDKQGDLGFASETIRRLVDICQVLDKFDIIEAFARIQRTMLCTRSSSTMGASMEPSICSGNCARRGLA